MAAQAGSGRKAPGGPASARPSPGSGRGPAFLRCACARVCACAHTLPGVPGRAAGEGWQAPWPVWDVAGAGGGVARANAPRASGQSAG